MANTAEQDSLTAPEDAATLMRRLQRARAFMWASAAMLGVSLFAVIACMRVEWSRVVPYLMWNHVAIMVVCMGGMFAVRGLRKRAAGRASPRPGELFAKPVLAMALVALVVAAPNWGLSAWSMAVAPDGTFASSHGWHVSDDGARYFESFNHGPAIEITEARYEQLNQGVYSVFARVWVFFSFGAFMMWRFVSLSRQDEISGREPVSPIPPISPAQSPQWKSTTLIASIWALVVGSNLVRLAEDRPQEHCAAFMPPEMRSIILAMPVVLFGLSALFMKRSPFSAPWIAGLVDEKLGAGSSDAFMARLRPLLLLSAASLIGAAPVVQGCWQRGEDWTMPGFMLSASVAFALCHVVLRWRRVPGV